MSVDDPTTTSAPPLVPARASRDELRGALAQANLPALLCVLHQLTGERCWLQAPYRPTAARGLDDHDDGGLVPSVQAEIREAAEAAISAWADGAPAAVPAPDLALLTEMMSACMGEPVAPEYAPMVAAEMGFAAPAAVEPLPSAGSVVVVGAGLSGMLAAARLSLAGFSVVVLEKNADVGGTWFENRYPGCGVDTPSHLYEVSFVPHAWSEHFAGRDEIYDYMHQLGETLDVRRLVRFGATVTRAAYDEHAGVWSVGYTDAAGHDQTLDANFVVTAVGQLNRPKLPALPGLDDFEGIVCHAARWPEGLQTAGRRIAVVGSGATAMQLVPRLSEVAGHLDVYQRSPGWVAPNAKYFEPVDADVRRLMSEIPFYRGWLRFRLAWAFNDKVYPSLRRDPAWAHPDRSVNALNDVYRRFFTAYLDAELAERPDLRVKCLPDYPPFGKRILIDNGWFKALRRPDVELVTEGVERVTASGIVTADKTERPVDVIVFATGFEASTPLAGITIEGSGGRELNATWQDDPRAFLGMSTPGFPNLFFLYGPNTNLGHGGSYTVLAECQVRYLADLLTRARRAGAETIECRPDVHDSYNRRVDAAHGGLIWSHPGMDTWYRNSRGRVVANYPWRVVDYWEMTNAADLADYEIRRSHDEPD